MSHRPMTDGGRRTSSTRHALSSWLWSSCWPPSRALTHPIEPGRKGPVVRSTSPAARLARPGRRLAADRSQLCGSDHRCSRCQRVGLPSPTVLLGILDRCEPTNTLGGRDGSKPETEFRQLDGGTKVVAIERGSVRCGGLAYIGQLSNRHPGSPSSVSPNRSRRLSASSRS
jgi:hypothetical protein